MESVTVCSMLFKLLLWHAHVCSLLFRSCVQPQCTNTVYHIQCKSVLCGFIMVLHGEERKSPATPRNQHGSVYRGVVRFGIPGTALLLVDFFCFRW